MKSPFARLAAVLVAVTLPHLSVELRAQEAAAEQQPAVVASLTPSTEVLTVGASFAVTLKIEVRQDTVLPATLFGGHDLQTYLDGERSVSLARTVVGEVPVAAGTMVQREIPIDAGVTWEVAELEGHRELKLEWNGLAGAVATVRLVPDQSGLDLDTVDMALSKVRLVTSKGDLVLSFRPDKAPGHVRNFMKLSKTGFYNGTRFHRIIRGFMIQGGDPYTRRGASGTPGSGGPGYTVDAEFNDIKHVRGVLSMARTADPNSAGSQFFLMHGKAQSLDEKYTAFGQVESGLEILDAIADTPVRQHPRSGEASVPVEDVWLYAAIVEPVMK